MLFPKIPVKAKKKENTAPKLSGEVTNLGTVETGKREFKSPRIPRAALMPHANKEEQVEKRAHWSDNKIPGMFLDSDYQCVITRTLGKKQEEIVDYDWQVIPSRSEGSERSSVPGTGSKFPVSVFYIDSDGDLSLHAKVGDSFVYQSVMNDESLAKYAALLENKSISSDGTIRRRSTSVDTNQLAEICTLSYGDYNAVFKNAMLGEMPLSNYVHYDRRDHPFEKNGKTVIKYCGALMCHPDAVEDLKIFIKQLGAGKKSIIYNN